jgi:UDP-N-acetylmuramate dehydrogenase
MFLKDVSLKQFNTMNVDVNAEYFFALNDVSQLKNIPLKDFVDNTIVIGSGSNILFTKNYSGLVIKNEIVGIEILSEDENIVKVIVGAGINWNEFVMYAIENNWSGIENLVLIPGTVGAAPVQNIGAYGQEVKNAILSLDAYDLHKNEFVTFSKSDCDFSYRNSVFKSKLKNMFIITSVTFQLKKHFVPNTSYPAISNVLSSQKNYSPSLNDIARIVIDIRQSKLPDCNVLGNCGSFFTNPLLSPEEFEKFIIEHSNAQFFKVDGGYKLSAGWLIENCGWKGKRIGGVGCYNLHALVIVNYGTATGNDIYNFANQIIDSVYKKFGVILKSEVNII